MSEKKGDIKLIVSFVGRGQGNGLARFYAEHHVSINFQSTGTGTASSELLDVLGIGSSEKDVIFSLASRENAGRLMSRLNDNLPGSVHAKGIVFMMPITGINHILAVILKRQGLGEGSIGGTEMEQNSTNSLILVVVNQGHTDEVMNTARGAGARGGTIIRSRLVGSGEQEPLYEGISHTEKEIIAMVTPISLRNTIMETINKKHGLKSEAGAVILSLGIDQIAKLS